MAHHGAESAHDARRLQLSRPVQQRFLTQSEPSGHLGKGTGDEGQILLERAHIGHVGWREIAPPQPIGGGENFRLRRRVLVEVKVRPDLEDPQRGQVQPVVHAGPPSQSPDLGFHFLPRRDSQGEPQVVVVGPGVVMAHAGMSVDPGGHVVQRAVVCMEGNQRALVAQATGVKDGADLADEVRLFQAAHPGEHPGFVETEGLGQGVEGARHQRNRQLQPLQQRTIRSIQLFHAATLPSARG